MNISNLVKFVSGVALVGVLAAVGAPAKAGGTAYITVGNVNWDSGHGDETNPPEVLSGGLWHVTVSSTADPLTWSVYAIADGVSKPADNATMISLEFFSSLSDLTTGSNPIFVDGGTATVVPLDTHNTGWTAPVGGQPAANSYTFAKSYGSPNPNVLKSDGSNYFTGTVKLHSTGGPLPSPAYIGAEMYTEKTVGTDPKIVITQHWDGFAMVTPNAATAAMLIPGLFPLGLMLRRRKSVK